MFKLEQPIKSKSEDLLGRTKFAVSLADAISDWHEPGSLVIGLYGRWGSGKSSVLNLLREHLDELSSDKIPTIIDFNPWMVSGQDQLLKHFFGQIAKELEIQNQEVNDRKVAEKLRLYASLLMSAPDISKLRSIIASFLAGSGLAGILIGLIISIFVSSAWGISFVLIGAIISLMRFSGEVLNSLAGFFEARSRLAHKTIERQKDDVNENLIKRNKRLLVIIDDVDRLTREEVGELIRLVKVNSDFSNTVYLLAFQRDIIENHLNDESGISGNDYLEKIIQVGFDIPDVNIARVQKYLFKELDEILAMLPESSQTLFDTERWTNLYYSGLRDLFGTIRNIKRYANSLRFNFSMLVKDGSIEVNPIDFMAIEAIRVFCPGYYHFMKANKDLFTSVESEYISDYASQERERRHNRLEESFLIIPEVQRDTVKGLLNRTFPGTVERSGYGPSWLDIWNRALMARSPNFFDAYFTLTPGGDEDALTQSQMDRLLIKSADSSELETELREHLAIGSIRNVLERLQSYTSGEGSIPEGHISNVIQALFSISDDLPQTQISMFDSGPSMDIMRIAYQFGKRLNDQIRFKSIILEAIKQSKSLSAPVEFVSLETPHKEHEQVDYIVSNADIGELQQACVKKILEFSAANKLFGSPTLIYILYRWKEWDNSEGWKDFIKMHTRLDREFLKFLRKFISEQKGQTIGDYAVRKKPIFGYQSLSGLMDLDDAKIRIESIKEKDKDLYSEFKELVDLFLKNIESEIRKLKPEEKPQDDP